MTTTLRILRLPNDNYTQDNSSTDDSQSVDGFYESIWKRHKCTYNATSIMRYNSNDDIQVYTAESSKSTVITYNVTSIMRYNSNDDIQVYTDESSKSTVITYNATSIRDTTAMMAYKCTQTSQVSLLSLPTMLQVL